MSTSILVLEEKQPHLYRPSDVFIRAGYSVKSAFSPREGLQLLQRGAYRAVLYDLPEAEVEVQELLQFAQTMPIPPAVVLLVRSCTIEMAVTALRLGAADYLEKPKRPEELIERVDDTLRRRTPVLRQLEAISGLAMSIELLQQEIQAMRTATPVVGDMLSEWPAGIRGQSQQNARLQIGRFPHEARYRGQPLNLTPIEYALLTCLAEKPGEVVSYEIIVGRTHGQQLTSTAAQAVLKSHVRNLRRKIGLELVVNVRKTGYRLAVELLEFP